MKEVQKISFPLKKLYKCLAVLSVLVFFGFILRNFSNLSEKLRDATLETTESESEYDDASSFKIDATSKPWFFTNGTRYPKPAVLSEELGKRVAKLLPFEGNGSDRFTEQMMFVPPNYDAIQKSGKYKTILSYFGLEVWWHVTEGTKIFTDLKCPVSTCRLTVNKSELETADLVLFHYRPIKERPKPNQVFALYSQEPPTKTPPTPYKKNINWTISYRHDSTIPAPYKMWMYYDPQIKQIEQTQNYAANKTKKVAWLVSNCKARNYRMEYVHELQKYIEVDIYGACGTFKCPCGKDIERRDYKFYLSFENSNCFEYITEKLFDNALNGNILPIVYGASREDYAKYAPERSYIHVEDFESPKKLAEYLNFLDKNDEMYNSYFKWKGTGEFIDSGTYLWCRICAVLHDDYSIESKLQYKDINNWWRGPGQCIKSFWRDYNPPKYDNNDYLGSEKFSNLRIQKSRKDED